MENTINQDKKWKILSSEYLCKRPWLTARRDVVELPDEKRVNNITLNDATFQGPMYDVRGNDNVNLGGGMNG